MKFQYIPVAVLLLFYTSRSYGQAVSDPATNIPATLPTLPAVTTYPGLTNITGVTKFNYIRTQVPDQPVTSIGTGTYYRQSANYFDGLGRPLQSVQKKVHPDGYDVVQHHVYDAAGREAYQYLPFASQLAWSDGKFSANALTRFTAFYPGSTGEHPYGKAEYDNSPLNRVIRQLAPGASWVGAGRGITSDYRTNSQTVFFISGSPSQTGVVSGAFPRITIGSAVADLPVIAGEYNEGELYITALQDEDGNYTEEVKDKLGRMVMKRVLYRKLSTDLLGATYPSAAPAQAFPVNMAYTFYVYDDLDRLRYVIPPEACKPVISAYNVTAIGTSANKLSYTYTFPAISTAISSGLCYRYVYDTRGRLIEKQIPGKGIEEYVYDQRDRPVFYRDAKMKLANKWLFTIYDALDRPVVTGIMPATATQAGLASVLSSTSTTASPHIYFFVKNYSFWHTYPEVVNTSLGNAEILTYTYYDDYADLPATGYAFNTAFLPAVSQPYLVASVKSNNTRGLVTGTKVKIMDGSATPNWLTTVNYYDEKGRPIQSVADNHKGGKDISSNVYYFQGMLWKNILQHQNPSAMAMSGLPMTTTRIENTYDRNIGIGGGSDQVWKVTQNINLGTDYEFAYYDYDHMGRITTKMFPAGNVLQEYNIRGWLSHISAYNSNGPWTSQKAFFEENLYYDKGFASKLYNGNIAGITWSGYRPASATGYTRRAYGYTYDRLNRISHAEYRDRPSLPLSAPWVKTATDYTMSNVTYDLNGNIQSMNQRGTEPGSATPEDMDVLDYDYMPGTNQLLKVEDAIPKENTALLPDFKNNAATAAEYTYDLNGNMVTDGNRKISAITYNYLNKPEQITVTGLGSISYLYDALGRRLSKTATAAGGTTTTFDYIGNFVYQSNKLQYILNEEGRARPRLADGSVKYYYDYFIKDHLGNVRTTVNAEPMTADYLASHEISAYAAEHLVFDNIENVWDDNPNGSPGNETAAHLIASDPNKRIGTAIMLRTMPGDEFRISSDCLYQGAYTPGSTVTPASMLSSLSSALLGGETYSGVPVSEMQQNVAIISQTMNNPALPGHLSDLISANTDAAAPQAYLTYLVFDQNLQLIPPKSGIVQVPTGGSGGIDWTTITPELLEGEAITIDAPGYIIVYVNNNSIGKDVYFDNIKIEHYAGTLLEENHYYPYGLTVSQAASGATAPENPYKYNTKELETTFGLQSYDYGARMYNSQIGRWNNLDPLADKYYNESPFAYVSNNPVKYIDPDGRFKLNYNDAQLKEQGLTRADVTRFESIVTNIGNLVASNPQAMDAIANTTGFDQSRITSDFQIGEGPNISILKGSGGGASGTTNGIVFDAEVIKSLANVDANDKAGLSKEVLGVALTLLHEYGHHGDQVTNQGKNTGQYIVIDGKNEIAGQSDAQYGKQRWKSSLSGHRGNDITIMGFGVKVESGKNGTSNVVRGKLSITTPQQYHDKVPISLPTEAKGDNILKTLNVKW